MRSNKGFSDLAGNFHPLAISVLRAKLLGRTSPGIPDRYHRAPPTLTAQMPESLLAQAGSVHHHGSNNS